MTVTVVDRGHPSGPPHEDIWQTQERVIIRLRAALRTLGKTTEEINAIAIDSDGAR